MNIKVLFFGRLREVAGTSEATMALDACANLSDLLMKLDELHGRAFGEELKSIQGLCILINGLEYRMLDGMATCLKDNDTVALLLPMEGG